ncbi:MAG TPA: nuclear transport factor 2 family protein [Chitinophagaceae bacterium]|nr:nuclear transport factor 2 family protein [Chitinophagaceae bacterium]
MSAIKLKFLPLLLSILYADYCHAQDTTGLHKTIVKLDSLFFDAYNTCNIEKQAAFYSDSIEFYTDKNGLETSKKVILENTKKYICDKVTRELIKGSIEVSPLPGYGAAELGSHLFHNSQEKNDVPHPSKFVIIWRNKDGKWTITKVISLH